MVRLTLALCTVAAVLVASEARTVMGWRERAAAIQTGYRAWQFNETGSNNGNENLAGTDLYSLSELILYNGCQWLTS